MTERTRTIVTYAICGFANFGSMGILIGGLSIMCPERRPDFLSLAWKTLYAGTLATIMAAAVVASLPYNLFRTGEAGPTPAAVEAPAEVAPPAMVAPDATDAAPPPVSPSSPITSPAPAQELPPVTTTPQTP